MFSVSTGLPENQIRLSYPVINSQNIDEKNSIMKRECSIKEKRQMDTKRGGSMKQNKRRRDVVST
jgi:hypothetical protein